jgi:DNA-binding NarL/FixJ family response regulator
LDSRVSQSASIRILIVEEFALFREMLGDFVRALPGHSVVAESATLAGGGEACRLHRPDIVILGWVLPDGTGDNLLRDVAPALPDTRWLVLGVHDGGAAVQTAISLGAQGVLMKHSGLDAFGQALRQLVA